MRPNYPFATTEQVKNNKEGGEEEDGINKSFNPLPIICGK